MIIAPGSTSQSLTIQLVDDAGLPVTGLVVSTFPAVKFKKAGNTAEVAITLSDLAAMTTAWTSGGVKESSGGYYRLDAPDAMFSTTARVTLIGDASGKHLIAPPIDVQNVAAVDSSGNAIPTANANADALLDRAAGVETGMTVRQAFRLLAAVLFGKSSNAGGTYRDTNDTKARVTATLDSSGNRTAVTRDAT